MSASRPPAMYRIILIGSAQSGKTALTQRWKDDTFSESYTYTMGIDTSRIPILDEKNKDSLYIADTSGDTRYQSIKNHCLKNKEVIVITLDSTDHYRKQLNEIKSYDFPTSASSGTSYIVVKTKIDGKANASIPTDEKQIISDLEKIGIPNAKIMSCSAKTGEGVTKLKEAIIAESKKVARPQVQESAEETLRKNIVAFKKIYAAMKAGESGWGWFRTNFLTTLENEEKRPGKSIADISRFISDYAQDNENSRTAKAWGLACHHANDTTPKNTALFTEIYKWSFANSAWYKTSNVSGTFFMSSNNFTSQKAENEIKITDNMKQQNTRSGKIYRALDMSSST